MHSYDLIIDCMCSRIIVIRIAFPLLPLGPRLVLDGCHKAISPKHWPLQWHNYEQDDVSNQRRIDLLNRLFRRRSKKVWMLRVTGLCEGNPPVTGGFPSQRASDAEIFHLMTPSWWLTYVMEMESSYLIHTQLEYNDDHVRLVLDLEQYFRLHFLSCNLDLIVACRYCTLI